MQSTLQYLLFGILTGSILAMATVGFSMIRQSEGIVNIAHGQFLALGALLGYFFVTSLGLNIFLAGLLSMLVVGLIGVTVNRIAFRPLASAGFAATLFTGIGLAYLLYGLDTAIFGPTVRFYPTSFGRRIALGSVNLTVGEIVLVAISLGTIVFLGIFLAKTRYGMWIRASASNAELARLRGVPIEWVSAGVWFISAALAGLAGVMVGLIGNASPEIGWQWILLILAASVLGGLGSIYGVLLGCMILGLAMDLSALFIPTSYRMVVAFVVLILVLLIRPQGIFAFAGRKETL